MHAVMIPSAIVRQLTIPVRKHSLHKIKISILLNTLKTTISQYELTTKDIDKDGFHFGI